MEALDNEFNFYKSLTYPLHDDLALYDVIQI